MTLTKDRCFGEQVKEQKKERKLFRHAGHEDIRPSTWLKLSRSVSTCSVVQHTGTSANSGPHTSTRSFRAFESSGFEKY